MECFNGCHTEVLPQSIEAAITPLQSLRTLGANSIDRAEIITLTLKQLNLKILLIEFATAKNLGELTNIFNKTRGVV
ncbi:MAG: hypothetical protein KBB94_10420 [Legionellaceae bacterium]|nr:hypothetical protein [Legionellaceae bacterium]